jgi:hypothetical protein
VLHKGITSIDARALDMTLYLKDVIYTGAQSDEIVSSIKTAFSGAAVTYGNHCTYYYGDQHLNDTNPCVINCTRCGAVNVPKENPVHNEIFTISYVRYDAPGVKGYACSNDGCKYATTTEAPALFNCVGYSAPESGILGISLGFMVNNKAISEYKEITGVDVKYGVFAASLDKLKDGDIFVNGVANANAICAEIKATEFTAFDIKVTGIAENQKDVMLALGAYVAVTKNGVTEYSYMQDETKGEKEGNYFFASFNDIIK